MKYKIGDKVKLLEYGKCRTGILIHLQGNALGLVLLDGDDEPTSFFGSDSIELDIERMRDDKIKKLFDDFN